MKKWFKKIGAMLLAGAMAALLFAGCSSDADVTIDVNALADDLRSSVTFNDDITKIDDAGIAMLYKDLDADLVVNQAVYASSGASTRLALLICTPMPSPIGVMATSVPRENSDIPRISSTAPATNIPSVPTGIGATVTLSSSMIAVMGSTDPSDSLIFSISILFIHDLPVPA